MVMQKLVVVGSRNILEDGQIEVRYDTYGVEAGERVVGPTHSREVIRPGQDVSDKHPMIQRIAAVEHTPEVIAAFERNRVPFPTPARDGG